MQSSINTIDLFAGLGGFTTATRIAGVNVVLVTPYTYLVDLLQRIQVHPKADILLLTPRMSQQHFADTP